MSGSRKRPARAAGSEAGVGTGKTFPRASSKTASQRAQDAEEPAVHPGEQGSAPSSEALYRALLKAVLDPTIAINAYGTVITASDSVEHVFGWKPEELAGRNVNVLMPEPHHGQHDEYLASYRRTGVTHILGRTREFEVLRKDGSRLVCELSVARAELAEGSGPLFIGSFRDVTERKLAESALQEAERRFRAIFNRSFQYIGLLSPEGTVLEANEASLQGAGLRREEVVGKPFWETRWWSVSEKGQERVKAALRAAASGEFVRFETELRGQGDEVLNVDFSLRPVFDESGAVVLLIPEGRDITELKRAQQSETAMLRALATIGESAAMLAHEIKNPITAVNVALKAVANQLGEDHKAVLEDLVGRMQRLEQIMRRTLSFTKPIELRMGEIDARALLADSVRQLRPQLVKLGADASVTAPDELVFHGDRQVLEEVFTNLLANSIEAAGPRAKVGLSAARDGDAGVIFRVEDSGPGIPDGVRSTLFKPFVTTKRKGTGLGLAFCKKVVEEHGGTIRAAASKALGGACFEVRLPLAPQRGHP